MFSILSSCALLRFYDSNTTCNKNIGSVDVCLIPPIKPIGVFCCIASKYVIIHNTECKDDISISNEDTFLVIFSRKYEAFVSEIPENLSSAIYT